MSEEIKIRRMTQEDVDGVWEIEKLCFSDPWSRDAFESELSGMNPCVYFVAECNDELCGYMGVWHIFDEGHVTNVAVHPDYRGRGIGEALVRTVISDGREKGVNSFTLEVRRTNEAAKSLYGKLGFIAAGVRKRYYENNEDAIIMWLRPEE